MTFPKGRLFGEIALLDPSKATRMLSGMTKVDCILLIFNQDAFDSLIKEKLKREKEVMGKFVHDTIPRLKDFLSFQAVCSNVHVLFKPQNFVKGQWAI